MEPRALVFTLFRGGCPSAIIWAIVAVVVDSINAVFRARLWSYVINKVLNRISPSLTDPYASAPPIPVLNIVGVIASIDHSCVCPVKGMVREPMLNGLSVSLGCSFAAQTSTGFSAPSSKERTLNDSFISAGAKAKPAGESVLYFCKLNYGKSGKYLSSKINTFRHNILHKMQLRMKGAWQTLRKTLFGFDALATDIQYTSFRGINHGY